MNFKNTLKKNPKLVVIGAGIAGVGAAGKLLTHGFTDIQIVEASSQPGGRIRSCLFGKSTVDEGAQYIHGASMKNPIFQLAKEHGLLQETHDRSDPELSVLTDMQKQMDPDVTKEVKNLASSILRRAHLIAQQKQYTQANSLADVYLEEVKTLVAQWDGDHTDLRRQKLGLLSMLMKWQCVHLAADSLSEVSVHEYEEYNNIEGHDRNSQGLFPDLLQKLLEVIPREKLLLKKPVQQILWNGSFESEDRSLYPVKVVCEDGGHILADHVILTISLATGGPAPPLIRKNYESALEIASGIPPETEAPRPSEAADLYLIRTSMTDRQIEFALCSHAQVLGSKWHRPLSQVPELNEIITENGCLKANGQSLFQPRLPEQKLNAIQSMGFGTMNKIYLEFEAPFWDENTDVIGLVWEEETPLSRQEPNLAEWWKRAPVFYVVRPTERYGHLLVGTISGKEAEFIESLSPQEVASSFTCLFRQFTGRSSLPGLTNVFVTKWFSNPYTRGSYSHISINSTGDMIDLLTEPLPQATEGSGSPTLQVLFAGEATHRSYHSTTHGALLSGWREADRLIDLYSTK